MTLDQHVRVAASSLLGWAYPPPCPQGGDKTAWSKAHPVRIPRELASPLIPTDVLYWDIGEGKWINCSPCTGAILGAVYPTRWQPGDWARLQVPQGEPWAPVDICLARGVGSPATEPRAGHWYLCQGWTWNGPPGVLNPASRGHAWLQFGLDRQLQATNWVDLDGDRKRTDAGRVTWTELPWRDQHARYDEVRLVELVAL